MFISLGWYVLRDFRRDVLQQHVLRNASFLKFCNDWIWISFFFEVKRWHWKINSPPEWLPLERRCRKKNSPGELITGNTVPPAKRYGLIFRDSLTFKRSWLGCHHNSLFPAHQSQSILVRHFARFASGLISYKNELTKTVTFCCMKNVNVRRTLTWKQSVPTFSQNYTVHEYGGHGPRKRSSIDSQCKI